MSLAMKTSFDVVVQKFGGSSVSTPEKIIDVSRFIKERLKSCERICVVISAMGHTTNDLIGLAHKVNLDPPKRELDMLISCGERSSMALLAMALNALDVKALSLTGSQSGIITDQCHAGAEIVAIRPDRVLKSFVDNQVVIIAGFQGVSYEKEITTLKRGGSDTTAVAMTKALNAKVCEIYSDVKGVFDADPRIVKKANIIDTISHEQMSTMSFYGAKIMAYDAACLADELGIEVLINETGHLLGGTKIIDTPIKKSSKGFCALTHLRSLVQYKVPLKDWLLLKAGHFLWGHLKEDNFIAYVSNDIAQKLPDFAQVEGGLGLISVHVDDQKTIADVFHNAVLLLDKSGIAIEDAIVSYKLISIVINDGMMNEALSLLKKDLSSMGELS